MTPNSHEHPAPTDVPVRLVLAEDDPELLALLTTRLSDGGFEVIACSDGLSLVEALEGCVGNARSYDVDVVVTDVRMPGVSGWSVLAGLNALGRGFPVVVMSAYLDEEARDLARSLRAAAVLEKPFAPDELIALVRRLIERRRAWARAWSADADGDTVS